MQSNQSPLTIAKEPVQRPLGMLGSVPAAGEDAPPRDKRPADAFRFYKLAAAAPVTGPAKAVLWVLAHHADYRSGRCFLYAETIAREAGVSERTARKATAELSALGIITKSPGRKRHSNEQGSNVYTIA